MLKMSKMHQWSSSQTLSFSSSTFSNLLQRVRDSCNFTFSSLLGHLLSVFFTCCFALVGALLVFLTGALIGQETESGFIRGAAIGAVSGAVLSLEVFESSVILWKSDESRIVCLLYLIDVIGSLLNGRLVREQIGSAMLSAVQSQFMNRSVKVLYKIMHEQTCSSVHSKYEN